MDAYTRLDGDSRRLHGTRDQWLHERDGKRTAVGGYIRHAIVANHMIFGPEVGAFGYIMCYELLILENEIASRKP